MASQINKSSTLTAAGMKMPVVGLGTWQATDEEIEVAIDTALKTGYRHIDAALVYMNEAAIGKTLKKWFDSGNIKREDLFIVTKINWMEHNINFFWLGQIKGTEMVKSLESRTLTTSYMLLVKMARLLDCFVKELPATSLRPEYVEETIKQSLADLQLSYVDLYLIHHPVGLVHGEGLLPRNPDGKVKLDLTTDHNAVWKVMEDQVYAGRAKAIGVSNFNIRQIENILKSARIPPATNQVEMYLYYQQKPLQEFSKKSGVTITAYAPLGSPNLESFVKVLGGKADNIRNLNPLEDPVVKRIANDHQKTPAQVLLRHLLQLGVAVIPKSINPSRIQSNFEVFDFELSPADMLELNSLDKGKEGQRFLGGLLHGIESHPEYPFKE